MAEEKEDKGFKVIDRRGQEPPSQGDASPIPPEKGAAGDAASAGNPPAAERVQEEKVGAGEAPPKSPPEGRPGAKANAGQGPSALGVPRFLDLVQSLQVGAMVGLGMIQGPDGKRPPVDLPAAKDAIDLLGILQEKTKGNLTKEEEEVLREGLYHLRMGYMAIANAPPAGQEKGGKQR
ncbi:MAG: hypothetical protein H6Q81_2187 [Deltaproteobacteria bacterium]|jgi:hypothetical protein|nr:hypothetical protein [Deltaproteobacteria bacterium]